MGDPMETANEQTIVRLLGLPPVSALLDQSADGQRLRTREVHCGGVGESIQGKIELHWRGERWLRSRGVLAELLPAPWSLAGALLENDGGFSASVHSDVLASFLLEIARADAALGEALGDGDRRFSLQGVGEHAERRTFIARRLPAVFDVGGRRPWFVRPDAVDGLAASFDLRAGAVSGFDGHRKFHWRLSPAPETRTPNASPAGSEGTSPRPTVVLSPGSC